MTPKWVEVCREQLNDVKCFDLIEFRSGVGGLSSHEIRMRKSEPLSIRTCYQSGLQWNREDLRHVDIRSLFLLWMCDLSAIGVLHSTGSLLRSGLMGGSGVTFSCDRTNEFYRSSNSGVQV